MAKADSSKDKAVELAVSQIERQYGKGAIMRLGEDSMPGAIPTISTGSLALDLALGVGGLPKGRVVEIFGPEASGKTTLALHVVAEAQKQGAFPPSSMPNMRWTFTMLRDWASRRMIFSSLNPIQGSRRWRSPTFSSGAVPWM